MASTGDGRTGPSVDEQMERLSSGVVDLVTAADLRARLVSSRATGRPLRVKVGFDPSAPDIHLGHTVLLRKMRQFQDLGHEVVFVIGDFTGMIGDPTGRSKTRPQLTKDEVEHNAGSYKEQAFRILDPARTSTRYNSEWLGRLGAEGFIRLAARYNVARMLERRDFRQRFEAGESIRIHEFLYPLAQAYDSVALEADVELGGTDQLFNLNVGRDIMPEYGLPSQIVMTTPLLEGTDGIEKMSKSLGNAIGVTDPPGEMFGKVMSISDDLMWRYAALLTGRTTAEVDALKADVAAGRVRAMDAKLDLAAFLVRTFHSVDAAAEACDEWTRVFSGRAVPADIASVDATPYLVRGPGGGEALTMDLVRILSDHGLAASRSEARRLIDQKALEIDGAPHAGYAWPVDEARLRGGIVLKVGKRRYLRLRRG
jgi:tyrosyl-tRNA synthetase